MTPKLTENGMAMMIRALNGEGINFTKIVIGNGEKPDDYKKLDNLINPQAEIEIVAAEKQEKDGYILLKGILRNSEISSGFYWTEIGIFASDKHGESDTLYAYRHYQIRDKTEDEGEIGATFIRKFQEDIVEMVLEEYVYIGDAGNVSASLAESSEYATKAELKDHLEKRNPHGITKMDIGLSNVENKGINDQTPNFSEANILSNLYSGERMAILLGKTKKAITDFIAHVSNKTLHITADERTKWNGKAEGSHNHSAANITSGTLGLARGGTGGTTKETAKFNLGLSGVGTYTRAVGELTTASADRHKSLTNLNLGEGVWVIICEAAAYSEITDFVEVSITKANMNNVPSNNFSCDQYGYGNLIGGGKVRVPFIYEVGATTTVYMNIYSKYSMEWYGTIHAVRII